jgi:hypothetical protein
LLQLHTASVTATAITEDLKTLKVKTWKEITKDRRTWRDLADKAKTHK